jgi:hypothetical protein
METPYWSPLDMRPPSCTLVGDNITDTVVSLCSVRAFQILPNLLLATLKAPARLVVTVVTVYRYDRTPSWVNPAMTDSNPYQGDTWSRAYPAR